MTSVILKFVSTLLFLCAIIKVNTTPIHSQQDYEVNICNDNKDIVSIIQRSITLGYRVQIRKKLTATTEIKLKLDSGGTIVFSSHLFVPQNDTARFITDIDIINNVFTFIILKDTSVFKFVVKGVKQLPEHPPYIVSLKINGEENCKEPNRTYFGEYEHIVDVVPFWADAPDKFCGRRRVSKEHTELIVHGSASQSGDWPWHSAIYRLHRSTLQYICGGTLISKHAVLTGDRFTAHCVTIGGAVVSPDILGVILGKHSLLGNDEVTTQNKGVYEVLVHDEFNHRTLNNDIAILKLSTQVVYNNYVQPACLWLDKAYDKLESFVVNGTVVGWGIDQSKTLSNKLRTTTMPILPDITCIRYDAIFYNNVLNGRKFCAGYSNGTAACNGDSGGGFMVFVPDSKTPYMKIFYMGVITYSPEIRPGAWYVKGIVSLSLTREDDSVCDPNAYTVFTDIAKYREWILDKM